MQREKSDRAGPFSPSRRQKLVIRRHHRQIPLRGRPPPRWLAVRRLCHDGPVPTSLPCRCGPSHIPHRTPAPPPERGGGAPEANLARIGPAVRQNEVRARLRPGPKINYERFRTRVPLQAYEHAQPWIERMKRGEADVLWPGTCNYYAVSSGTATGRTRHLPVTSAMIAHFRRAGALSSLFYTSRTGHARVFRGRHLILGGSTSLDPIQESRPFMALAGDMSGIVAKQLPGWVEKHLY